MPQLDSTYLRCIYDGLIKGSIHPGNSSELPEGLTGLYEEAFDAEIPVRQRENILRRFALFALLKKEVSISFAAEILGEKEETISGFIAKYASWFNTPESGKYSLYHERLRIYFLQKIQEKELRKLNGDLIARLQRAIGEKKNDAFELYALQFLSDHLLAEAFADEEKGRELLDFNQNESIWNRQIRISNQFSWTKNSIHNTILWTSKFNLPESIFGYLDLVELHHKEQNDAETIISLVSGGEIDQALKRIESFGGDDQERVNSSFILYLLCLVELTLLESKEKPFRKPAIEKLLNHLDENIPPDTSIINWNDFFPSYLMFLMACEWAELGLDYLMVYKRTDDWEKDWLTEKGPYNDIQFEVLLECARAITNDELKSSALASISGELAKQRKVEEALAYPSNISRANWKCSELVEISNELARQGKVEEAASAMQEALACARGLSDNFLKLSELKYISNELAKQGMVEEVALVMQEALVCAGSIIDEPYKISALAEISTELARQGKVEEALVCARNIGDDFRKGKAQKDISNELAKQGKVEEALAFARDISDDNLWKHTAFNGIYTELARQGKAGEAASTMQEALVYVRGISDNNFWKRSALVEISNEMVKHGKVEEALAWARSIGRDNWKCRALLEISTELAKQGKVNEAALVMQEALACARGINDESKRISALGEISNELAKQGKVEEALACAGNISRDNWKCSALVKISTELTTQGKSEEATIVMQEALACAGGIHDESDKIRALLEISNELTGQRKVEEAASVMQEALACARGINDESDKSWALNFISTALAKQGNWSLVEKTGLEIPQIDDQHDCWEEMGRTITKQVGWQKALQEYVNLQNEEDRLFYLKGWAASVNLNDVDATCLQEALPFLVNDMESMQTLLEKYTIHALFFGEADKEHIRRLNKTLNIQWAMDIKAQFTASTQAQRLSSNVNEWLHEIADEDNREQIKSWVMEVTRGKISEREFGKNVSKL